MEGKQLYVLFEHACGYGLFKVREFEEIGEIIPEVSGAVSDLAHFNSVVKLVAFNAFKSSKAALENINAISEGIVHPDLKNFIVSNFPMKKTVLGCGHRGLAESIQGEMELPCLHAGAVPEITRGIRLHFPKMVPGLSRAHENKGEIGLGHSYSRAKIKFNINRADNMIIQSINLLDQMDKDINTFVMRLREWYSYHFPELVKLVPDNHSYVKCVVAIKSRADLNEDIVEQLEEILMDSTVAQSVYDASKSSMGMDITPLDLMNIEHFSQHILRLIEKRRAFLSYLQSKMSTVAPNLCELIGESVAARLISQAGSLTNLAKFPASTVQILGAEKALFRALKTRGNTPKYGLIFHSTFIGRAAKENKGKISRFLASKCSLASRIDCFSDVPTSVFGEHLKKQVEDRLKSFDTGEHGLTNSEVMSEAVVQAKLAVEQAQKEERKKKRKEKKAKRKKIKEELENAVDEEEAEEVMEEVRTPKKKKKKSLSVEEEDVDDVLEETTPKKKKRKKRSLPVDEEEMEDIVSEETTPKKKKKKKSLPLDEEEQVTPRTRSPVMKGEQIATEESQKKKKKKKKSLAVEEEEVDEEKNQHVTPKKKLQIKEEPESEMQSPKKSNRKSEVSEESAKKKKKNRTMDSEPMEVDEPILENGGGSSKKKKKKRKSDGDL